MMMMTLCRETWELKISINLLTIHIFYSKSTLHLSSGHAALLQYAKKTFLSSNAEHRGEDIHHDKRDEYDVWIFQLSRADEKKTSNSLSSTLQSETDVDDDKKKWKSSGEWKTSSSTSPYHQFIGNEIWIFWLTLNVCVSTPFASNTAHDDI